jgi:hypothetical protein
MAKKQKKGIAGTVLKLLMVLPAVLNMTASLIAMVQSEFLTMRKKLVLFMVLAFFCLALMMGVWLCVTGLLVIYLQTLQLGLSSSLMIVLVFNFLLLVITGLAMSFIKVDPTFPETRKVVKDIVL